MKHDRKATTLAGSFYLLGILAGILSISYAVDDPGYLVKAASNENGVLIAGFFHFLMAPLYVGIAVVLYPILKEFSPGLALGFVSFRLIAGVFVIMGVVILLSILSLSREFVKAGTPDLSYFHIIGGLLQNGRDLVNHVAMILSVSTGGLMFYYLLYRTRLVPRWLSGWGIMGAMLAMAASMLYFFRLIGIITPMYLILNIPMALQEIIFAVWLIARGFDQTADVAGFQNP